MNRFFYISGYYPPLNYTGSIRPYKICKYIRSHGWDPLVLSIDPNSSGVKSDFSVDDLSDVQQEVVPLSSPGMINDFGVRWYKNLLKAIEKHQLHRGVDAVLISGSPFYSFKIGYELNKRYGIPYILDYRDLWAGDPYPARTFKDKVFRLYARYEESRLLKKAFCSTYVSEHMRLDQLGLYPSIPSDRLKVVSTGYDPEDFFHDQALPETVLELKRQGITIISHIGTLDPYMSEVDLVMIVKRASQVEEGLEKKIKILLIGRDNGRVVQLAKEQGIAGLFMDLGFLGKNDAQAYMFHSDVLLILASSHPQRLNRKIFEYLASKTPVLFYGHPMGAGAAVLNKVGGGWVLDARHPEKFKDLLIDLCKHNAPFFPELDMEKLKDYSHPHLAGEFANLMNAAKEFGVMR
jgi:glycosyltransferase involved in cell wall biosynthesis